MMHCLLPELSLALGIILAIGLTMAENLSPVKVRRIMIAWTALVIAAVLISSDCRALLFAQSYKIDPYSQYFKLLIACGLGANLLLGWPLRNIPRLQSTEYYLFFFSAALGMMLLSSAFSFLVLYLSMELTSYSLYILIAMRRDRTESIESAVKVFLIGAASSAVGLYGLTFIYGSLHGLGFQDLLAVLKSGSIPLGTLGPGLVMLFSSFLFKMAAFPFHVWAPDVYDSAASPVAMYLASVAKLAGIAALFRLVLLAHPHLPLMGTALGVIAVMTMTYGNFVAFRQRSVKRLYAYSSIAQAGYIILGMLGVAQSAPQAVLYYSTIYMVMNIALFMVTIELEQKEPDPPIEGFRGLHQRSALMAMTLMLTLFSLAGVPPLAGFFGKWLLFSSAAEAGYVWLVVLAIANSVVSLFYYLYLVKSAYFGDPGEMHPPLVSKPTPRLAAIVVMLILIGLGTYPYPLMSYLLNLDLSRTMLP